MTTTSFVDALAAIRSEVLVAFSSTACQAPHNPVAAWLGRLFARELAIRGGEVAEDLQPLTLAEDDREFALEWLDFAAQTYVDVARDHGDSGLALLACLLRHLRLTIDRKAAALSMH